MSAFLLIFFFYTSFGMLTAVISMVSSRLADVDGADAFFLAFLSMIFWPIALPFYVSYTIYRAVARYYDL